MVELVSLDPDSELAKKLKDDSGKEYVLVTNGRHFRVVEEKDVDLFQEYSPEKVRETIDLHKGSWLGVDPEKLKKDLRTWRGIGSKPPLRWDDELDDWVLADAAYIDSVLEEYRQVDRTE